MKIKFNVFFLKKIKVLMKTKFLRELFKDWQKSNKIFTIIYCPLKMHLDKFYYF